MRNLSPFQLIVLAVFAAGLVIAVLVFAGILPGFEGAIGNREREVEVSLWGSIPSGQMATFIRVFNSENEGSLSLRYSEIEPDEFEEALVDALARGQGPDLAILPPEIQVSQEDKFFFIPYESIDARTFRETFLPIGNMYLADRGVQALPLAVDPLVMYYNPSVFINAGLPEIPRTWTDIILAQSVVTKSDSLTNVISQATIAFGEFRNVSYAKEILLALFMQAGDRVVERSGNSYQITLANGQETTNADTAAVGFFTQFADPSKSTYSWNRSLNLDREEFLSGDLAIYFGFASELEDLRARNPNLRFEVLPIPQRDDVGERITFGRLYGVGILQASNNKNSALAAALSLTGQTMAPDLLDLLQMSPARRDLIARGRAGADAFTSVFYESALISQGFFDPAPNETWNIFGTMTSDVNTRRQTASSAVKRAGEQLSNLFDNI